MLKRILFSLLAFLFFFLPMSGASNRFTLVIDAGHGGHDSGARGAISSEKDLTLKFSLAFGRMVEQRCPDVKVVYTRTSDVFVPLHKRADIANKNKADLFISVHINAVMPGHLARGFQSYTLGSGERSGDRGIKENLEVAKRENSVIFLEKDYKTRYKGYDNSVEGDIMFEFIADKNRERSVELSRLMQQEVCKATGRADGGSHQNNLAVLRLTSMPAALLELGFISTPDEELFMNSEPATDMYARGIFNAFVLYKNKYNDNIDVPYREPIETTSTVTVTDNAVSPTPQRKQQPTVTPPPSSPKVEDVKPTDTSSAVKTPVRTVPTPRQEPRTQAVVAPVSDKVDLSKPIFKIQIFSSSYQFKSGDKVFQGLEGCENYQENNYYKYTYGASNNYNVIYRLRKQILEKFPQCFIIAFKGGKKIDVNEGIREFKANR